MTKGVSNEINDCSLAVEHFGILYKPSKPTVKVVPMESVCLYVYIRMLTRATGCGTGKHPYINVETQILLELTVKVAMFE